MKSNEIIAIELLEVVTNDITTIEQRKLLFNDYRSWILGLSKEGIKDAIIGCATFRYVNGNLKLFSSSKQEKQTAKHNVKVANNFIDFADSIFLIK